MKMVHMEVEAEEVSSSTFFQEYVARYKTSENKLTPLKHYSQQNYMEVEDLV
jgi:hypothetical protein